MKKNVKDDNACQAASTLSIPTDLPLSAESQARLRLQRIDDYQTASLRNPDPLRAVLGAVNANLLRIDLKFEQAILEHLEASPQPAAALANAIPAIDIHLRLLRQVDRHAVFEQAARALEVARTPQYPAGSSLAIPGEETAI